MFPFQSERRSLLISSIVRWNGEDFIDDAREVRLGGSILYADLKSLDGTWKRASIDLNVVIGNKDGQLVNGTTNFVSIADGMLIALNSRCW